eukprot:gnl/TRDRNA2_/TRDRNA2_175042_c1_seq76.p1 gnl/TRDRNA2_/TRDRNA2_175042_c1~~gnl/TRDRNA2_/TRDRNA2_175042_c1_seq76.p1  ORF type:complete len:199 (-),score=17.13 gnl/TRDRNA2_/TRDRNA2_175042_c1_seq76:113-709(-)
MSSILIFLSALVAASSIRPPTPSGKSTSLRAGSSNAHRTNRTSVAGSITEAEIQRVRGECKESCPNLPYGKYQCCVPECAMKTYECRDSACEKEVLNYVKKKYIPPEKQKETFRGWSSWLNRTNSNTSVKVQGGHHFTDAEIQETTQICKGTCHTTIDDCCVKKCKVDLYECHVDKSNYESCHEAVTTVHDPTPRAGF